MGEFSWTAKGPILGYQQNAINKEKCPDAHNIVLNIVYTYQNARMHMCVYQNKITGPKNTQIYFTAGRPDINNNFKY